MQARAAEQHHLQHLAQKHTMCDASLAMGSRRRLTLARANDPVSRIPPRLIRISARSAHRPDGFPASFDRVCILPEASEASEAHLLDGSQSSQRPPRADIGPRSPAAAALVLTLQPDQDDSQILYRAAGLLGPSIIALLDSTQVGSGQWVDGRRWAVGC